MYLTFLKDTTNVRYGATRKQNDGHRNRVVTAPPPLPGAAPHRRHRKLNRRQLRHTRRQPSTSSNGGELFKDENNHRQREDLRREPGYPPRVREQRHLRYGYGT